MGLFDNKNNLFHDKNAGLGIAYLNHDLVREYPIATPRYVSVGDEIALKVPVWAEKGKKVAQYKIVKGRVVKVPPRFTSTSRIEIVDSRHKYIRITVQTLFFGDAHKKYDETLAGTDDDETDRHKKFVKETVTNISGVIEHPSVYRFNNKDFESSARKYGIEDLTLQKELYETALLLYVKSLNLNSSKKSFDKIVEIYNNQIALNLRTSNSVMLQQYSTPIPLAWLAGIYVKHNLKKDASYLEPSAGNGMLTIAFSRKEEPKIMVNEIDKNRLNNLIKFHNFYDSIEPPHDASKPFHKVWQKYNDGIITNPPFGSITPQEFGTEKRYKISKLEHAMTIHALDTMRDSGRAAIIVGGHTEWDEYGKIKNGADRYFLSYLHHYYNVEDVINIKGDMYSKQGTRFPIRLILINGRKATPDGTAPLKTTDDWTVNNWSELWNRVEHYITLKRQITLTEMRRLTAAEKLALQEIAEMEKEMGLSGFDLSGIKTGKRKTGNYQEIKSLEDLFLCTIYRFPAYYSFGTIDKKAAETVKSKTKIDVKGYELHLDTDHLRHFYDRHYKETDGQHLGIKFSDFQKLIYIVDSFTNVEVGNTPDSLVFTKKFTTGNYELVVIIDSKNKFLYGKSFRINT